MYTEEGGGKGTFKSSVDIQLGKYYFPCIVKSFYTLFYEEVSSLTWIYKFWTFLDSAFKFSNNFELK